MLFDMSFDKNSPKYIRCTNIQLGSEIEVVEIGYNKVPPGKVHILTRDVSEHRIRFRMCLCDCSR